MDYPLFKYTMQFYNVTVLHKLSKKEPPPPRKKKKTHHFSYHNYGLYKHGITDYNCCDNAKQ